jgi:DNA repair protein RadC
MDDRPRDRLLNKGKEALSNAELMAILLNSGNKNESALMLSKRVLDSVDNRLNNLSKLTLTDLNKFKGIGNAKAITIVAAIELGRRRRMEDSSKSLTIRNSCEVFDLMQPIIGELKYEEFWVIFLNNSNRVIEKYQLSKGGLTGTIVDVRMVFKKAVELLATGLILCHNHPSGKINPSQSDKTITEKMKVAGKTLDIKILDHLIITENDYFSFADEQVL